MTTTVDFEALDESELKDLADFFVVDVVAVDDDNPTKKELVAALISGENPVSVEDYDTFKKAHAAGTAGSTETTFEPKDNEPEEEVDKTDWVLIKFDGNNPSIQILGFQFYKRHPFQQVPPSVAEYLIKNSEGFRLALPSELADYYN